VSQARTAGRSEGGEATDHRADGIGTTRHLGLDLGGTNVKLVVLERTADRGEPRIVATTSVPTGSDSGPDAVTDRMIEAGSALAAAHRPVATAGIGVPGLFEAATGRIRLFPNLPGPWLGHPLRERLAEGLGLPVAMINDARAFVVAEAALGAGRGHRTVVGLTLGTGVGGGVIVDGRLHLGASGTGGEIGHQTVEPDGPLCGCGNRGCAEVLAQAATIARLGGRESAEAVFAGAVAGDARCVAAVGSAVRALSIALANVVTVLVPDVIVVGGGIAAAHAVFLDPLRAAIRDRAPLVATEHIRVVAAQLGSAAGAIGAALAGMGSADDGATERAGDVRDLGRVGGAAAPSSAAGGRVPAAGADLSQ
jgi:glucokinase